MMNEENNIDKLFREKLEHFSEAPPAFVWDGVREKLEAGRKKRYVAWYSWAAVAALLVLAFIAGWYFNESTGPMIPQTAEKEVVKPNGNEASEMQNEADEPIIEEENRRDEQQNAQFLADAAGVKPAAKNTGARKESVGTETAVASDGREQMALPEQMQRIEANFHATNQFQPEAEGLMAEKSTGLSSYEKEIVAQNAAVFAAPEKENTGWRMGVNVSPGYSSYSANYAKDYASNMTQAANDGNASMSGGIALRYRTASRWSVESGIYYAQNGKQAGSSPQAFGGRADEMYAVAPERLYFNTAVKMENSRVAMNSVAGVIEMKNLPAGAEIAADLENAGFYGNSLITQGEISQVFDLVEIPLYLRYLVMDAKLDVEVLGGINTGVVVGNQAFLDNQYGVQRIGKTRDISTMNISGTVGVAFSYELGKQLSLGLEPRFNYYLNSISRNPEVEFRPYRIGLYTGLYYAF